MYIHPQGGADSMQRLISITEVARTLCVSPSLIREAEKRGVIPAAQRIEGLNRRVYTDADLAALREWRKRVQRTGDDAA